MAFPRAAFLPPPPHPPSSCPLPPPLWARHQAGTSGHHLIPSFPGAFEVDLAGSQMGKLRLQEAAARDAQPGGAAAGVSPGLQAWGPAQASGPATSNAPGGQGPPLEPARSLQVLPGGHSLPGPRALPLRATRECPHVAECARCGGRPCITAGRSPPNGRPSLGRHGLHVHLGGHPPRRAQHGRAGVPSPGACRAGLPGPRLQPHFTASSLPSPVLVPPKVDSPDTPSTNCQEGRAWSFCPAPPPPPGQPDPEGPAQAQGLSSIPGAQDKGGETAGPSLTDG